MIEVVFGIRGDVDAAQMAARAFVMFFIALALVRLAGMRAFGHKSAFDTIVVIVLGALLSRPIVGASEFWPTVASAVVLVLVHRVLAVIGVRFPSVDRLIKGSELVLYDKGVLDHRAMLRAGISHNDIAAALRQQGFEQLEEARMIYKEANGKLSVISCSSRALRSPPARHADPLA
ncbi:MAG: DUF421 domain-containing protein [Deltaproteobacteria bacterium]|nr:DUF421 domain-containing protein [Deltaproteobacteria bacterium]